MNTFYIYALFYRGVPYYLGKGHKKRLHSHERLCPQGQFTQGQASIKFVEEKEI